MHFINPYNRKQTEFYCPEEALEADHPVRFIDAFSEKLDLTALGYQPKAIQSEGRPSFDPRVFLKLYLYGYLLGIRSS